MFENKIYGHMSSTERRIHWYVCIHISIHRYIHFTYKLQGQHGGGDPNRHQLNIMHPVYEQPTV